MNDIKAFEKQYQAVLDSAIADANLPPALLDQFLVDSCIRLGDKKALYLVTRRADGARGILRITDDYPEEDALAEAKLLAALDHPAIPKVFAAYEQGRRKYFVREYIEGNTLTDIVKDSGTFSAEDIYGVVTQLCDVLDYLHNLTPPVIHRDIKPQNIIIAPDGCVHLIDFGIAREFKLGLNQDTAIILTGRYAPPEQFGYDQSSALTDIYSLGMTMIYMATGRTEKAGLEDQIKDKTLLRLIAGCVAFDPKARFQSVRKVAKFIKRHQGQKKLRRRLLRALMLVAIIAVAVGPAYYLGYRMGDTHQQESKASAAPPALQETPYDAAYGNVPGNLTSGEGGFAVRSEDAVYYLHSDALYKMNPKTGKAQEIATAPDAFSLNYYEGWLYFSTQYEILRVSAQTGEQEVFAKDIWGQLRIIDGQFYVRNALDSLKLYQLSADGKEAVKLNDRTRYFYLNIVGDRMYFTDHDNKRKLYSCNLDGSDLKEIYGSACEWLCIYENQIYCFNMGENGGSLVRMDLSGENVEHLLRDVTNYTNVTPGGIFYTRGNDRTLEWMSFDSRTRFTIAPQKAGSFNIAGEWIFYPNKDDGDALWRVRIDGTDNSKVE